MDLIDERARPTDRRRPLLFEAVPALATRVPWMPVAHAPTPVEVLTGFGEHGETPRLWVKRDDLASPLYGGNKVRRFEYILPEALARGARELVTVGGLASTQVTATLFFSRAAGLRARAVLFDQPRTEFGRRALLTNVDAGGTLVWGGGYPRTVMRTLALLARGRSNTHFVWPGASNPLYNLSYVDALLELAQQVERGELPRPDVIVTPSGSGGTAAGLAVGVGLLRWPTEIIGVRITERVACNRATVGVLAHATARLLRHQGRTAIDGRVRVSIDHRFAGRGYGHPTDLARRYAGYVKKITGSDGEITYSGKGLAALAQIAEERPRQQILYWHTLSSVRGPPRATADQLPHALQAVFREPTVA